MRAVVSHSVEQKNGRYGGHAWTLPWLRLVAATTCLYSYVAAAVTSIAKDGAEL